MTRIASLVSCTVLAVAMLVAPVWGQEDLEADEGMAIIHSGGESHVFTVEIADDDATRARGLMFREELAPDNGMLFDFWDERPVAFWMQNTLISLDMLFIKADGTIAKVHAEAVPMDRTSIPSDEPVRFVLEIAGGRAAELGIEAGDVLEHPRVEADDATEGDGAE